MRIIVAGDIHLGRSSSQIPDETDVDVSAAGAWQRLIDLTIQRQADALLITGDLLDRDEAYFEARTAIRAGLERLLEARPGLRVVLISGNHDDQSLPRVIDALGFPEEQVILLGRDGTWQRTELQGENFRVSVDGWSYPTSTPRSQPLNQLDRDRPQGPRLVLLHGDYASSSQYAAIVPADARSLATQIDALLLGHIHFKGDVQREESPLVLYTGSPQALDPGEPGRHGCWELNLNSQGIVDRTYHRVSTVRYDTLEIDADNISSREDLERYLDDEIDGWFEDSEETRVVIPRLIVKGWHEEPDLIREWADELLKSWTPTKHHGRLDRVDVPVIRPLDLQAISSGEKNGPHVVAARLLKDLQSEDSSVPPEFFKQLISAVEEARNKRDFRDIDDERNDNEEERLKSHLNKALTHLLDSMVGGSSL